MISSIFNEEKTSKISSNQRSSWYFNMPLIRNRLINIIEKEEEDTISKWLVRYNYIKYNDRMIDFYIKVIYKSRNQGL